MFLVKTGIYAEIMVDTVSFVKDKHTL